MSYLIYLPFILMALIVVGVNQHYSGKGSFKKKQLKPALCARCGKPKEKWETAGVTERGIQYCCEGCFNDQGCTCVNNRYDFDNRDTTPIIKSMRP